MTFWILSFNMIRSADNFVTKSKQYEIDEKTEQGTLIISWQKTVAIPKYLILTFCKIVNSNILLKC